MTWHDATVLTIAFGAFTCGWAIGRYQGTGRRLRQPKPLYGLAGFIEGPVAASNRRGGPRTQKPMMGAVAQGGAWEDKRPNSSGDRPRRWRGGYMPMPSRDGANLPPRNP